MRYSNFGFILALLALTFLLGCNKEKTICKESIFGFGHNKTFNANSTINDFIVNDQYDHNKILTLIIGEIPAKTGTVNKLHFNGFNCKIDDYSNQYTFDLIDSIVIKIVCSDNSILPITETAILPKIKSKNYSYTTNIDLSAFPKESTFTVQLLAAGKSSPSNKIELSTTLDFWVDYCFTTTK
jgi:hypothetical protein